MITEVVSMPIAVIVAGVLQLIVYIVATYLHLQRLAQRLSLIHISRRQSGRSVSGG